MTWIKHYELSLLGLEYMSIRRTITPRYKMMYNETHIEDSVIQLMVSVQYFKEHCIRHGLSTMT